MNRLYKLLLAFLFAGCFAPEQTLAQGRTGVWYFGNQAGVVFGSNGPTAVSDGSLNSYEACATISTETGNLALYTDGEKVWDAAHQLMPNGSGMGGHTSASQSALILPNPANATQYLVFTVDAIDNNLIGGLRYSVVDMTLRAGLGDVVAASKLTRLPTPTINGKVTEKLTAALHANGRDYWVVVHGWQNNEFYSFLVSPSGVSTTPVVSTVGPVHIGGGSFFGAGNAVGYMRVSPLGTHLALAQRDTQFELYSFNNASGIISNYLALSGRNEYFYGIEFSPDNSRLYASMYSQGGYDSDIYQFNLLAGSSSAIRNSQQVVASYAGLGVAMQLGPDNKIYVSAFNRPYLHAIRQPNVLGTACNFQRDAVFLGQKLAQNGLPNFPNAFARQPNSVSNPQLAHLVDVYPSPASQQVQLKIAKEFISEYVRLEVVNSLGQRLKTLQLSTQAGQNIILPVGDLARGVYTLQISSAKGMLSKRLLLD